MKHPHQNQEFRFNEVLFEGRNKEYGAYVLRNESDRILTRALFVGVSLLAAVSITPFVINAFKSEPVIDRTVYDGGHIFKQVDVPEKDPPAQVKTQPAPEKIKTIDKTVPEPKAIVTNEKKDTPKDNLNAVASTQTSEGKEITTPTYIPIAPPTNGNGTSKENVVTKVEPKEDPYKIVDSKDLGQEAVFVGGVDSFRNKVMNNFDGSGFGSDDVMRTTITFIVEKDGTISGIKATGSDADFNNEAIRTIKYIKGKWTPAKNKQGEFVRSYFKFPISMKFDN
ncbi:energy transducer TonB [Chryseobacterium camelliae]|uniref:Energy transducer TonB n=1 Tax=Chryseobacterium camelliae TaxID=1265445 RepID=A0ABY7QKI3_9FLAO|nr:energy transducer TonB [Chryseobacterium camelliae]WBV60154.1 energy transducer TonB [Chryseobacterium camelliae]